MPATREQIEAALRRMDSATLRGRLATGEMSPQARLLARALLDERDRTGSEGDSADGAASATATPDVPRDDDASAAGEFLRRPFGWHWGLWLGMVLLLLPILASFGTHTRNPSDRSFLLGVIVLQAVVVAGIVRAVASIFDASLSSGLIGRLLSLGLLVVVLGGLAFCSSFARTGWLGG